MLSKSDALRAFARMMNTFDASHIEDLLADDFHYASQNVFHEITSKQEYMEYIRPKLETVRKSGGPVWAEMAEMTYAFPGPCLVLAQGEHNNLVATVFAKVNGNRITRIDMCIVPPPSAAIRSGEFPK